MAKKKKKRIRPSMSEGLKKTLTGDYFFGIGDDALDEASRIDKVKAFERTAQVKTRAKKIKGANPGVLKRLLKNPIARTVGGGMAASLALEFAPDIYQGIKDTFDLGQLGNRMTGTQENILLEDQVNRYAREVQSRQARIQKLRQQNMMNILTWRPDLANQILAGRELPPDATVIGGTPKVDLLAQVADQMAAGRFGTPEQSGGMGGF